MLYDDICRKAASVRQKYETRDPFLLCEAMGILLFRRPLGTAPDAIKGFYFEACRIPSITINSDLPEAVQRIILAHELGHFFLHRKKGVQNFTDVGLFDLAAIAEKEANLFAAELLLDDEEVLELLRERRAFSSVAAQLRVPAELLDFKLRLMQQKGYEIAPSPITARNGFLANIEVPRDADWYC